MRLVLVFTGLAALAYPQADLGPDYPKLCAGCHGDAAAGTDRGPGLINSRSLRRRGLEQIRRVIRDGTPGGMPAFPMSAAALDTLASAVHRLNASAFDARPAGDAAAGKRFFADAGRCASCHRVAGIGASNGPDLSNVGRELTVAEIEAVPDNPSARKGSRNSASCPGWAFCPDEPWGVATVRLKNGGTLRGFTRSKGRHDVQLQTLDGKLHLLSAAEYTSIEPEKQSIMPPLKASATERRDLVAYLASLGGVRAGPLASDPGPVPAAHQRAVQRPASGEWPGYHGKPSGNRHSELRQITAANVAKVRAQWTWSIPYHGLEMTPLVADGVMYVTGPNQVCALDAGSGREIWCYTRPRTQGGIAGDAAKGAQRGAALLGDRVFFTTDDARLICLDRLTGALMWEVLMPVSKGAFGATSSPLIVHDLVIAGVAGGDGPLRGFLAAYKATTGELAWRFWTVPEKGEPASETWGDGRALVTGGGATWLTGSYDPDLDLLYWPTGNPFPATDGDSRPGDNLYTDAVIALEPRTGKLRWHFQFTPHDLWDWDATEPLVLVDAAFRGRPRKLLLQANRNGFFYVLDRVTGEFLLGEPFVKRLTWATGIGPDGRPRVNPDSKPSRAGTRTCPAVRGATNWYSTAYSPDTKLFYVMAVEDCNLYRQSGMGGYLPLHDPANPPAKYLRAIDVETGKVKWEVEQPGAPESNYSGVLSTAGGLVFYGESGGTFAAADARTGKTLWHFNTGQVWKASPMTYTAKGRQHVAIAAGGTVYSFALATE